MKTIVGTWKTIFKDWGDFEVYFTEEIPQRNALLLNDLLNSQIEIISFRECKSHQILFIRFSDQNRFNFVLKAFFARLLKRNRAKHYLNIIKILDHLKIPVVKPLLIFWKNSVEAFFRREVFYGGVLFPYIEKGFIKDTMFFKDHKKEDLNLSFIKDLLKFIFEVHQKGVVIRDTKYNNFFYDEAEGFKLFDLDGVRFLGRPLKKTERLKDLVSLAITLYRDKIVSYELVFNWYRELYQDLEEKDINLLTLLIHRKKSK